MFGVLLNSCYHNINRAGAKFKPADLIWAKAQENLKLGSCPEACPSGAGQQRGVPGDCGTGCLSLLAFPPHSSLTTASSLVSAQSAPLGPTCSLCLGLESTQVCFACFFLSVGC